VEKMMKVRTGTGLFRMDVRRNGGRAGPPDQPAQHRVSQFQARPHIRHEMTGGFTSARGPGGPGGAAEAMKLRDAAGAYAGTGGPVESRRTQVCGEVEQGAGISKLAAGAAGVAAERAEKKAGADGGDD
jgi:hypothetical protein